MRKCIAICILLLVLMAPASAWAADEVDLASEFLPSGPPLGTRDEPPEGVSTPPIIIFVPQPAVPTPTPVPVAPEDEEEVIQIVPHNLLMIHRVQPGQTLSYIARYVYPDLDHYNNRVHTEAINQIVRDNPIIRNPDLIQAGWDLEIFAFGSIPVPPVDQARAEAALEFPHLPVEHFIQPGENLSLIAIRHFPTLNLDRDEDLRLSVIAQIARDNEIANPHHIEAGTYITINPFVRR